MTLAAQLARYFEARPNIWIDARALLDVSGFAAWRTRLSELRRAPFGMTIENRQHRETFMGRTWTVSEYRYVPQERIFDAQQIKRLDDETAVCLAVRNSDVARPL